MPYTHWPANHTCIHVQYITLPHIHIHVHTHTHTQREREREEEREREGEREREHDTRRGRETMSGRGGERDTEMAWPT